MKFARLTEFMPSAEVDKSTILTSSSARAAQTHLIFSKTDKNKTVTVDYNNGDSYHRLSIHGVDKEAKEEYRFTDTVEQTIKWLKEVGFDEYVPQEKDMLNGKRLVLNHNTLSNHEIKHRAKG